MQFIADFHLHSHYSRATSKDMDLENIYRWSKIKGIQLVGTGDFTHPKWFKELSEKMKPAEPGLFKLKDDLSLVQDKSLPDSIRQQEHRFILTTEISNIYSKNDRVRKMHNIVIAPGLETVAKINNKLQTIGNISSDGRPILGLDSKDLLKLLLEIDKNILFVPAHIWTPWFSLFGSKSGFDTIEEAFEELSPEIKTIETGLSSDPHMNWRLKQLQDLSIISNSNAHSPNKLGREANIFNCNLDYSEIIGALKTNDQRLLGTIEFFPQEGKYHADGHRVCSVRFSPSETKAHQGICPVCHKPLVVGVEHRVDDLADSPQSFEKRNNKSVEYIIPLTEIIAELSHIKSSTAPKVMAEYEKIYSALGNEFNILRNVPTDKIKAAGFNKLATAIEKMRSHDVNIEAGYDGVYGKIRVFKDANDIKKSGGQSALF